MRTGCIGRGLRETRRIHDSRWQGIPVREIIRERAHREGMGPTPAGGGGAPGPGPCTRRLGPEWLWRVRRWSLPPPRRRTHNGRQTNTKS